MKLAVIGGTGLIGSQVVQILNASGHEAVPQSPSTGLDPAIAENADENTVRLPATLIQPVASADVAQAVAGVSAGRPLPGTRSVAGPEVFALDELGKITLAARGDQRTVVTDNSAGMFAAATGDALIAKDGAVLAQTTYREWLAR